MKKLVISILTAILVFGVLLSTVQASPDGPLTESFTAEGSYDVVANGVGLFDNSSGTISLNVPGSVVEAFLYWAGWDNISGSDDTVSFSVDGGSATSLTADRIFGPDFFWNDSTTDYYHYVYAENVTALVVSGSHTYNISDVAMLHNYGAGLMVVYEDLSLPISVVKIYDGLDSGHFRFPDPRGPNTNVTSLEFDPVDYYSDLDIITFVGGTENASRANALWYQSGSGIIPSNLVGEGSATMLDGPPPPYPMGAYDGQEWDTYSISTNVQIGESWACIQLESYNDTVDLGASLLLTSSAFVLTQRLPPPPVGGEIFSANTIELLLPYILSISLIAIVLVAARNRKHHQIPS
jgi:hypothetical protein